MLYRNGENLKQELRKYLADKNKITIFCPYIKGNSLEGILETPGLECEQIIVRWEPHDLLRGASDLNVFEICRDKGISLYMNPRIHLKLFTNNFIDAFSGSANISERAMSESTSSSYNYEICTYTSKLETSDRIYLRSIINESTLVTEELFKVLQQQLNDANKVPDLFTIPKSQTDFLISQLPMTDTPNYLWELYSGIKDFTDQQEENCFCHDIVLYKLSGLEQDEELWLQTLKSNFFASAFIQKFLEQVDSSNKVRHGQVREGLRFGAVRKWFADNTTTVPSPRPFELTSNVQILYRWIVELSDGDYEVFVPGSRSQVIKRRN